MKSRSALRLSLALGFVACTGRSPRLCRRPLAFQPQKVARRPSLLTGIPEAKLRWKPALDPYVIRRRFVRVAADDLKRLPTLKTLSLELFDGSTGECPASSTANAR